MLNCLLSCNYVELFIYWLLCFDFCFILFWKTNLYLCDFCVIFTQVLDFELVHLDVNHHRVVELVPLLCVHPPSDYSGLLLLILLVLPGNTTENKFFFFGLFIFSTPKSSTNSILILLRNNLLQEFPYVKTIQVSSYQEEISSEIKSIFFSF